MDCRIPPKPVLQSLNEQRFLCQKRGNHCTHVSCHRRHAAWATASVALSGVHGPHVCSSARVWPVQAGLSWAGLPAVGSPSGPPGLHPLALVATPRYFSCGERRQSQSHIALQTPLGHILEHLMGHRKWSGHSRVSRDRAWQPAH